jgi:hypothetical protein
MKKVLQKQIIAARAALEKTHSKTSDTRVSFHRKIDLLAKAAHVFEETWGGDWINSPNLYKENFESSNPNWEGVDETRIRLYLKGQTEIDLNEIRNDMTNLSRQFFELRDFLISELSFINNDESFKNETELLKQIENFKWGIELGEYTRSRRPMYAFLQDPTILNRGLKTPPHIEIGEQIIFTYSLLSSYDNFEKLGNRLIRQLEIKTSDDDTDSIPVVNKLTFNVLFDRFHLVVTQIKNRYNDRSTILIDDEYDVQDLMNALLRINYEDIRKEEYTPSYAGGSTRIDFLLKREKTLIEVKKTRANLKDKEVGNQLILDIAHYRSHPDCKKLVCFVYDPENLIINPRGLEDDLNRASTDDMIVEVYIRP